jgi:hypothetical protein
MYLRGGWLPRDDRRTNVRAWLLALFALGIAAASLSGAHGPPTASAASGADTPVDIEIAIDGTGSMASAIAKAKSEGVRALSGISSLLPDSRFAVVVFRDHGNPAGEYQLLQPLSSDAAQVQGALNRVTTHSNPSPNNGPAESYNFAFHQSYSDARIGWRPSARKIVVVLGDAEPNGAGTTGVPGCRDRSSDPEGLSTPRELANMRAAGLTLIMIRELSAGLSVSLQCYESIAAGAYSGGTARDASGDLAAMIVELIEGAYAPVTLTNDLGVALRNDRTGYTITVGNPNALALKIKSLAFVLPQSGFRYVRSSISSTRPVQSGRTLTWALNMSLRPRQVIGFHVLVRTPGQVGRYQSNVITSFETAAGHELVSRRPGALLSVRRRLHAVRLSFLRKTAAGTVVTGKAAASFSRWKGLPAVGRARGRLVVQAGKRRLVLQAAGLRLDSLAVPTRVRLRLRVIGSSGDRACRVGARATLLVSDSNNQNGRSSTFVLSLPRACGGQTIPKGTLTFAAN